MKHLNCSPREFWYLYVLLSIVGIISNASSQEIPVYKLWKEGDWWTIKIIQQADYMRVAQPSWIEFGSWKFNVMAVNGREVYINVIDLNRPESSHEWELRLRYNNTNGELDDVHYKVAGKTFSKDRALLYIPVGSACFIVDHPIDSLKSAPMVKRLDIRTEQEVDFFKIEIKEDEAFQLWRDGDPWWRYYENKRSFPIKAELIATSWWQK